MTNKESPVGSIHWHRALSALRPWAVVLSTLGVSLGAHAALFGDDEARRAILELRQQRTKDQDTNTAQLAALSTQLDQLKRSLLDMNAQLEQLRADMARQRGDNEVLVRDVSELQRHQKDLQQGINERVAKLEPQSVTLDGKTFLADPEEKRLFEEALAKLRQADFAGGSAGLKEFLRKYPATGYKESVLYWLGNASYGLRDYKESISQFKSLLTLSPQHMRAPEAMLSISNCHSELKETKAARRALDDLIKNYPDSEAAQAARERLAAASSKSRG